MALTISVIVCAYNEADYLAACLHSLLAQTRPRTKSSSSTTPAPMRRPRLRAPSPASAWSTSRAKGWCVARETGRLAGHRRHPGLSRRRLPRAARLARAHRAAIRARPALVALSGPYRFYDWDWCGPGADSRLRLHAGAARRSCSSITCCGIGTIFYGGNFAVRRDGARAHRRLRHARSSSTARTPTSGAG